MTTLPPGTRLGPYQILDLIGAGGMGEVYRATDTRLDRIVAIKLLPRHWAENAEMRQRFEREAQIVASLKHPNICVLHDIGQQDGHNFLVMEYLEGGTLGERLARGPMDWEEALKVSIAIADALDKAHRGGVVHRDLKPSNVILTASGPKLLDFGLAKWKTVGSVFSGPAVSASQAETRTNVTTPGAILGTLQYMAPEQLEGLEADARTDIFAFGALLHEMVTGKRAFDAKSRILLMSAIATSEPEPISNAQPAAPAALVHLVKVCLAKDPQDRWQTARDVLAELEWIAGGGAAEAGAALSAAPEERKRARRSRVLAWALAALAFVLVAATAVPAALYFRAPRAPDEFRFRIDVTTNAEPQRTGSAGGRSTAGTNFAVSADGRSLAYVSRSTGTDPYALYIRPIDSVTPRRLAGTEDALLPFWSADGRFIAYTIGGKLKKVEASGGPPQDICDAAGFTGGTWNREGTILFGSSTGLQRVSAEGGKPEAVTSLEGGESGHYWPQFLPDGRHYLYTVWNGEPAKRAVFVGMLGSKDKTRILAAESNAFYAEPAFSEHGYILFHRESAVYAQPFDLKNLVDSKKPALSGEPVRVADEIGFLAGNGGSSFAVSPNGVLVYFRPPSTQNAGAGAESDTADWQLTWTDRKAKVLGMPGPYGPYRGFEVSPDGKRIAVHRHDAAGGDILVIEPNNSVKKLTFDATHHNSSPVWSPKGDYIVYSAIEKGKWGLYRTLSSGSGTEELLYESELLKAPMSWSPDGKRIVFWVQDPKTGGDLWVLNVEDKKAEPLIATMFNETHGQISPDGKWIAYTSNLTGRNEIFVQPFPSGAGRAQVSFHGGDWPRWKGDGKELFYHSIANTQDQAARFDAFANGPLLSAAVAGLVAGTPKEVIRMAAINLPHSGGDYQTYAVSADGQRILGLEYVNSTATASGTNGPEPDDNFTVAMHWAAGMKK